MGIRQAIKKTLAYGDLFEYPLTFSQIQEFCPLKIDETLLKKNLDEMATIKRKKNYYYFSGKEDTITLREERHVYSREKLKIAKNICKKLSIIPTVQLIGISGALAMDNCTKNDDIDFFVITNNKTLWVTRLLMLFILQLVGKRRRRNESNANNKICLNMMLSETCLELSKKRQTIYGAHEIIQMVPLMQRQNMYNRFIVANSWVFNFLPNAKLKKIDENEKGNWLFPFAIQFLEPVSKMVQKAYMRKTTKEEVSDNLLAFHPKNYQEMVLRALV